MVRLCEIIDHFALVGGYLMLRLNLKQLSQYNGKDRPEMYVAVNGEIYDVTHVKHWAHGNHHGHYAGTDLTNVMKDSPHGNQVLKWLKVVGVLVK